MCQYPNFIGYSVGEALARYRLQNLAPGAAEELGRDPRGFTVIPRMELAYGAGWWLYNP